MRVCTGAVFFLFFLSLAVVGQQQDPQQAPSGAQQAPAAQQEPAGQQSPADQGQQAPAGQQPAGEAGQQAPNAPEPQLPEPQEPPEPRSMPRLEFFAGFSYVGADPFSVNTQSPLRGWEANFTINAARWLGFVADFGGSYGTTRIPVSVPTPFPPCPPFCPLSTGTFPVNTHLYTYLFGVRLPYRKWERFTPFAQLLYGRAHVSGEDQGTSEIDTKGALSGGLGVDFAITKRFTWRVQGDYERTKFFRLTEDNYRVSTGIVLHWSRKKKKRTLVTP